MSTTTVRRIAIAEPISIFLLIMAYIWDLRYRLPAVWLLILALMLLSHWLRRERAGSLGFRSVQLRACWHEYGPVLAFLSLLLLAAGTLLQTTRSIAFDRALIAWAAYVPWGLLQQYIVNGYFFNRLDTVLPRHAPLLTAALFSGAHLPNWFLMIVTLGAGYCCACIYRRYKNLYFLGVAHATIGFCLFLVIPDSISHHLVVGPGWFLH